MEKSPQARHTENELPPTPAPPPIPYKQEGHAIRALSIKRKPIGDDGSETVSNITPVSTARATSPPASIAPPTPPKETYLAQDQQHEKALAPNTSTLSSTPFPTARPLLTRLRIRWSLLRRRTRFLILGGLIILLALIIGLSAGLSVSHAGSRVKNLPLPSNHGGPYTGDFTYYDPGLGSCGITSSSSDAIVAVSHVIFDAASTGSNPNANPLCGKKIRARRGDASVDITVVDRCVGCKATDLDVSSSVFLDLVPNSQGGLGVGRTTVEWAWLEDVPASAAG